MQRTCLLLTLVVALSGLTATAINLAQVCLDQLDVPAISKHKLVLKDLPKSEQCLKIYLLIDEMVHKECSTCKVQQTEEDRTSRMDEAPRLLRRASQLLSGRKATSSSLLSYLDDCAKELDIQLGHTGQPDANLKSAVGGDLNEFDRLRVANRVYQGQLNLLRGQLKLDKKDVSADLERQLLRAQEKNNELLEANLKIARKLTQTEEELKAARKPAEVNLAAQLDQCERQLVLKGQELKRAMDRLQEKQLVAG